jgi:hypothetical protein
MLAGSAVLDVILTTGGVGRAPAGRSQRGDHALVGVAATCLGVLGLMALFVMPVLVVAVLPPALVLYRLGVQVARLEHAATRDGTTVCSIPTAGVRWPSLWSSDATVASEPVS